MRKCASGLEQYIRLLKTHADAFRSMSFFVGEKMNTEDFQRSVQEADNNTLRIGAANRIVQKLDELRYSNNDVVQ